MHNIVDVRGLGKSYSTFSLKDVSFQIPAGYIMGFIGPNGAGKTTTIKSILGMTGYETGQVELFGLDARAHLPQINQQVGVVMDMPYYSEDWTALEVQKAVSLFYGAWNGAVYRDLLGKFNIDPTKKVKELSRGMKVKLMMAVALSHDAKLLVLDEPTSGLDPVARDELCELLGDFVTDENKSVLFSTHITSDLEKIADYITFILDGRIVFSGLKDEMLEQFVAIKGGLNDISAREKGLIIGLREHGTGFEGMVRQGDMGKLGKNLLFEPVSLEQIIIYMNKGAALHE